jgi:hypothetical protein
MKSKDIEIIQSKIHVIRKQKVMLDRDLAELYGVETRALNQAVKRNIERFPEDFMFQLTNEELKDWMSQIVISNKEKMGLRKLPFAFTQNGIAMLSSVLASKNAIEVNIRIMRVFVKTSELLRNQSEIYKKIEKIEKQGLENSEDIKTLFKAMKELYGFQEKNKSKKIGFDK